MDLAYLRKLMAVRDEIRVQAHPATDAWMAGDRYGVVARVGRELIHVKMDRSGRVRKFRPDDVEQI
ncbi:hypothetical protein ACGF8D_10535 [Streptomyces massasporeus]|uniref:hypothetical protein n=1 Tax=Streptomyces massasporeus TaxID=67324 RepID=UPI003712A77A